jgi:hypothetical protein
MGSRLNKRRSYRGRDRISDRPRGASAVRVIPARASPVVRAVHLFILLGLVLLLFLSQGCALLAPTLLGAAASTATKTGISYSLDSRAQKTFTAPVPEVRTSLLAALEEMGFPIETDEKTDEGHRILAKTDGREVEVELEAVTPKATKVRVVVREGWFWKDRATAEEIVEQTGRGVEATMIAAKGGGVIRRVPTALFHTLPGVEPHLAAAAPAALDPWDPQRWGEGFQKAPAPMAPIVSPRLPPEVAGHPGSPAAPAAPAVPPVAPVAVAFPIIAVDGGRTGPPPEVPALTEKGAGRPSLLPAVDTRLASRGNGNGNGNGNGATGDMRWRVLRTLPLRPCPDTACVGDASVKRGELVVRLREKGRWCRAWVAGTDVVGWIPCDDLTPPAGVDGTPGPIAVSAQTPR